MPIGNLHKKKLKKNLTVLAIIVGICVLIWGVTVVKIKKANAGEVYECGKATTYDLPTDSPVDACDAYTRQLAYREEAIKLRAQLKERAENFAAPARMLHEQYKQDLEELHDSIDAADIPTIMP